MDKILHLTLLYDFYGELLTKRQQQVFEMYHQDDLSMQEIGEQFGISRQAVNDLLKRTEKILDDYENKLCLVSSHILNNDKINAIVKSIDRLIDSGVAPDSLCEIKQAIFDMNK